MNFMRSHDDKYTSEQYFYNCDAVEWRQIPRINASGAKGVTWDHGRDGRLLLGSGGFRLKEDTISHT